MSIDAACMIELEELEREERAEKRKQDARRDLLLPHWDVSPSAHAVDVTALLSRIENRIRRHVVMSDEAALTSALWVMLTWTHEATVHSPILLVNSPEAGCGKTTLLGVISYLSRRGLNSVQGTAAVVYRTIDKWAPTLVLDEADVLFKDNPEMRAVVNAGYTRNAGILRCHPTTHEPIYFVSFCPKAIGMKAMKVPDTTLSRCIVLPMQRKLAGERREPFEHDDDDELREIRSQLSRFADDHTDEIAMASPQLPEGFDNRLANNWESLLAIAELCGQGDRARAAALVMSRQTDSASAGVEFLRDVAIVLAEIVDDEIWAEEIVTALNAMDTRPWCEWNHGKGMSKTQLSNRLKEFRIPTGHQVWKRGQNKKGYRRDWFTDVLNRYLPSDDGGSPNDRGH